DAVMMRFELGTDTDGVKLARQFKNHDPDLPIIVYTDDYDENVYSTDNYKGIESGKVYQALVRESFLNGVGQFYPFWRNNCGQYIRTVKNTRESDIGLMVKDFSSFRSCDQRDNIDYVRNKSVFEERLQPLSKDDSIDTIIPALYDQFFRQNLKRRIPIHIKAGGSHFDLVEDKTDPNAIADFAKYLVKFASDHPGYAVIVSPGGGHLNDNLKDWIANPNIELNPGDRLLEKMAQQILEVQAQKLLSAIGDECARIVDPNDPLALGEITDEMFDEKPIMIWPYAPRELRRLYGLSMAYSDAQTFATGALFKARRTLFSKNAHGIYTADPNRNDFREKQGKKIIEVTANDLEGGYVMIDDEQYPITRVGTDNRGQHLCEDKGLEFMFSVGYPKRVCVAHPKTPNLLERVFVNDDLVRGTGRNIDYETSISSIVQSYCQRDGFP
ncbi:hypothetical protein JXC34_04290, partial [Candidatus Woesearchaeota archaeon]|nr:hypothetical protein [Candidatus Woesearchaeota archaeon]